MSRVFSMVGLCFPSNRKYNCLWQCAQNRLEPPPTGDQVRAITLITEDTLILIPAEQGMLPTAERRKSSLTFSQLFGIFSSTTSSLSSALILIELRREKRNQFTLRMMPLTKHYGICRKEGKKINPSTNKISALFLHLLLLCPYLG